MEEQKTVWEMCFDALKNNDIDVYPPAIHDGECKSEYVVIKDAGSERFSNYSTKSQFYDFLLYIPHQKYSSLESFKKKVEDILAKELFPMIMPTGEWTEVYFDDEIKAYMTSTMYRNNVRNKHL